MLSLALLISPLAKGAFFNKYLEVCRAEISGMLGEREVHHHKIAEMDFFYVDIDEKHLSEIARLSFVYGLFQRHGEALQPLNVDPEYFLHPDFVFGAKFKGKTNEILTQMMINVGLQTLEFKKLDEVKLLDPMCGRATTLLWAMRYGIKSKGIEQDSKALDDIRRNIKKWCKIHRQKHALNEGFVGKSNKKGLGKFIEFVANDCSMRVINGNTCDSTNLLKGEKFHLIVSDLPYGVQHFTTEKTRNPIAVIQESAKGWCDSLKAGGVMVLAYNRYIPKRKDLISVFENLGMEVQAFEAEHRMSEAIVRDILVLKKPR